MDSEDLYAAEFAITMDEGIPFEPALMLSKLAVLEQRWPRLKARCDVLRDRLRLRPGVHLEGEPDECDATQV